MCPKTGEGGGNNMHILAKPKLGTVKIYIQAVLLNPQDWLHLQLQEQLKSLLLHVNQLQK